MLSLEAAPHLLILLQYILAMSVDLDWKTVREKNGMQWQIRSFHGVPWKFFYASLLFYFAEFLKVVHDLSAPMPESDP